MKPPVSIYSPLAVLLFLTAAPASAATVTGWTLDQSSAALNNANTGSPIVGDGTADNADDSAISASFADLTLAAPGDRITLSGSVTFSGGVSAGDVFRFGMFNAGSSLTTTGWLGYFGSNSTGSASSSNGHLRERNNPNNSFYATGGAATTLAEVSSGQSFTASNTTYLFLLSYERKNDNSLDLVWSLKNGASYDLTGNFNDGTPQTFTFNRVGFHSGTGQNADQITFNTIDVSLIPEPSTILLASLACPFFFLRRRTAD